MHHRPYSRWLFVLSLLLCFTLGMAQQHGGTFRVGMQTDPVGLDPHSTNATATRNMLENTYETLVFINSSGLIVPGLAESWETSEDGLTWTFQLREGVLFHNGDPLQASDVVYSIMRIKDPTTTSPRANDFAVIDSIEAPDASTVVMNLSQPFSPLLSKLAQSLNVIVSEAVASSASLNEVVVGTGPFRFVEYLPQTRLVLERFENYWDVDEAGNALPYVDGITFTFYPDPAARTTAVQTASVDWVEYVPAADIDLLELDPDVVIAGGLAANFRSMQMNTAEPPFDNVLLRQAVSYAIDEQEIIDLALFGTGGVLSEGTTIPAGNFYAVENNPYIGRQPERARELLEQAGFPDGFSFELYVTSTYDFLRDPAEVIQANLAEVGIEVSIVAEDWTIYLPKALNSEFQATLLGSSGQTDPDDFLFTHFHTRVAAGTNPSQLSDPEVDRLLQEGRLVADQEERRAIYQAAQERILELAPHSFLFHSAQYAAMQSYVQGYEHYPNTSYLSFRRVWLDR